MDEQFDDSRIFTRFIPSLLHLSSVQVGIQLLNDFDFETLMHTYRSIKEGKLIILNEFGKDLKLMKYELALLKCKRKQMKCEIELIECEKALLKTKDIKYKASTLKSYSIYLRNHEYEIEKKMIEHREVLRKMYNLQQRLVMLSPCMRLRVMYSVQGLEFGARQWKADHSSILKLKDKEIIFYWKSNGMIDATRTAKQLVMNASIDIRKRFCLASTYCFEELMPSLWKELISSGKIHYLEKTKNAAVNFWYMRMLQGSKLSWEQAFYFFIKFSPRYRILRFSCVFPMLKPDHRIKILLSLECAKLEDFWLCWQAFTKEEEKYLLSVYPYKLLYTYLQWPLRSLFLETTKKIWFFRGISDFTFLFLLNRLFFIKEYEEFDISELFQGFWNMSNLDLEKVTRICNHDMIKEINSWLREIRRKEKSLFDELRSYKNKVVES